MSIAVDSIQTFPKLVQVAAQCRLCPNMMFGRTFLNEHNGPVPADIMMVGEATNVGRDDQLPKPMWDSPSGDNLNKLLHSIGIERNEVFVTNTVLHTPRSPVRHGEKPFMRYVSPEEQMNCSSYLQKQIELVQPRIVCTLGARALQGFALSYPGCEGFRLKYDAARPFKIHSSFWLIPLYHPSPNALTMVRDWAHQFEDYKSIPRTLEMLNGLRVPREVI